jgi:hypothetical protein
MPLDERILQGVITEAGIKCVCVGSYGTRSMVIILEQQKKVLYCVLSVCLSLEFSSLELA